MLDALIEASNEEMDSRRRAALLQDCAAAIRDDAALLPLVVPDELYAIAPDAPWTPRPDGNLLAYEVIP